ncbi:MAG: OmpA family protein [Marinibacterium sp.]|nr:OmpA family protein [Marinibacterium sp.]
MRLKAFLLTSATLIGAAGLSVLAAGYAVTAVEEGSEIAVRARLDAAGHDWAEVQADGLQVILSGTAADEAIRLDALSQVGGVVDPARIINKTDVTPAQDLAPPRFSIEFLRNEAGVSVIGLIPTSTDRAALLAQLITLADGAPVTELLETADFDAPKGWDAAMRYALQVATELPRSKISITADAIAVTAITDSREAKQELDARLPRRAPAGLELTLDIAAPRPVITPFTLRYVLDAAGGHFDACSADTEAARTRIVAAAPHLDGDNGTGCVVGMGVPSPRWGDAATLSLQALGTLGGGSLNISDADVALIAAEGTDPRLFDRVVGELETTLPPVFSLKAVLPVVEDDDAEGPPEFTGTRSPEGLVQLRGRIRDATIRGLADGLARARFGTDNVRTALRSVDDLPQGWSLRVLTGIEALSWLDHGAVVVTPDMLDLRGVTHHEDANARLSQLITGKLGETAAFTLDLTYEAPPPPREAKLSPELCAEQIVSELSRNKIRFEPGSATIDPASAATMDVLADIIKQCGDMRMEIQGHTDAQGREEMNQELSQARAQSVLDELRARRIPTARFVATGYGESRPIATNDTAAGRETNRRIEFVLLEAESGEGPSILDLIANTPGASRPGDNTNAPAPQETDDEQN